VCAARGAFNAALGLVDSMCSNGPKPTTVTYNVLVRGAVNAAQLETASKILEQMPKLGASRCQLLPALPSAWRTALIRPPPARPLPTPHATRSPGLISRAPGAMPDAFSYSMVVNGYAHAGDAKQALKWLKKMPPALVTPMTYHGLFSALCDAGETRVALDQLAAMRKAGIAPLPRTMRLLLEKFGEDSFQMD
jgi:pentatricopeptide repeat protein